MYKYQKKSLILKKSTIILYIQNYSTEWFKYICSLPDVEGTDAELCDCLIAGACAQGPCVSRSAQAQACLRRPPSWGHAPAASLKISSAECLLHGSHYSVSRCLPSTMESTSFKPRLDPDGGLPVPWFATSTAFVGPSFGPHFGFFSPGTVGVVLVTVGLDC